MYMDLALTESRGIVSEDLEALTHSKSVSQREARPVSSLKYLTLRGFWTSELLDDSAEGTLLDALVATGVQLSHLSLQAEEWFSDDLELAHPFFLSQAPTLTMFTLRWCQLVSYFPIFMFRDCQFSSLRVLSVQLEWDSPSGTDRTISDEMKDVAQVVSLSPVLQNIYVHLKPPSRATAGPIAALHWQELDCALVEKRVFIGISADEKDIFGKDAPLLFTEKRLQQALRLSFASGLLGVYDYDGSFDWCTLSDA
ncbi:hypothetical protein DL96DRAFT_1622610 [Flagelloscypha sp. PMI_526]|nr:hypothetical protein DL96DRAFT_1622610 [Flagelloscypha sp. PMI_526]